TPARAFERDRPKESRMPDQITKLPRGVSADKYLDQIRAAAFDAFLEVLRGKSDDPGIDLTNLLSAIRDGSEAATLALLRSGEIRPAFPRSIPEPDVSAAEGEPRP